MPLFIVIYSPPEINGSAHNNTLAFWKNFCKENQEYTRA